MVNAAALRSPAGRWGRRRDTAARAGGASGATKDDLASSGTDVGAVRTKAAVMVGGIGGRRDGVVILTRRKWSTRVRGFKSVTERAACVTGTKRFRNL